MATITTRSGKGSPLTNNEVDANFNNLNTDKAELSGAAFTGAITTNSTFDGRDVATDGTKLDGIESGATADQTAAQIKTAYESNSDTNAFTDADHSKLDGIEASADVTDTANVTSAGALMDSELTSIASVKALNQGVAATDSPTFVDVTATSLDISGNIDVDGTTNLDVVDIDGALTQDGGAVFNEASADVDFRVESDGNANMLFVDGGNNRVGVGTGSPNRDLHISGGASDIAFGITNSASGTSASDGFSITVENPTPDVAIRQRENANMKFLTNNTERMRIDSSGNVGIGEDSTPLGKLHVKTADSGATVDASADELVIEGSGNAGMSILTGASSTGSIYFGDSGTNWDGYIAYSQNSRAMTFGTAAGGGSMTIDSSGRVGIGCTPASKLDIDISTDARGSFSSGIGEVGSGNFALQVTNSAGSALKPLGFRAEDIRFATGSAESMRIESSGSVNISGSASGTEQFRVGNSTGGTDFGITVTENSGVVLNSAEGSSARSMTFSTGGSPKMTLTSGGNLLVGVTSTATPGVGNTTAGVSIRGDDGSFFSRSLGSGDTNNVVSFNRSTAGNILGFQKDGTTVGSIGVVGGDDLFIAGGATGLRFDSDTAKIYPTNGSGAVSNGALDIGETNFNFRDLYLSGVANIGGTAKFASWSNSGASNGIEIRSADSQILNSHTGTSLHFYQYFYNANGIVGSISASGSSTSYNTSSDYRLKENVVAMSGATERLKQLEPKRFNFIADADATVDGFLAHEVADVVPEAITGTKDAMKDEDYEVTPAVLDDEGNVTTEAVMGTRSVPDYQGIDQSKLVPLLVATIQELEARISALEA